MYEIEQKLLNILLSYKDHNDIYHFIDIIIELNKNGVSKEKLIKILNNILGKLDDSQIVQNDIVGDILDYMTAWSTPKKETKVYKLFSYFNDDKS